MPRRAGATGVHARAGRQQRALLRERGGDRARHLGARQRRAAAMPGERPPARARELLR
jgi:hypothetical protein